MSETTATLDIVRRRKTACVAQEVRPGFITVHTDIRASATQCSIQQRHRCFSRKKERAYRKEKNGEDIPFTTYSIGIPEYK